MSFLTRLLRLETKAPKPLPEAAQGKQGDLLDAGYRERINFFEDILTEAYGTAGAAPTGVQDKEALALLEELDRRGFFAGYELDAADLSKLDVECPDAGRRAVLLRQWVDGWRLHLAGQFPRLSAAKLKEIASHEGEDKLRAKLTDLAARKKDEDYEAARIKREKKKQRQEAAQAARGDIDKGKNRTLTQRIIEGVVGKKEPEEKLEPPAEIIYEYDEAGDRWPRPIQSQPTVTIIGEDSGWASLLTDDENNGD